MTAFFMRAPTPRIFSLSVPSLGRMIPAPASMYMCPGMMCRAPVRRDQTGKRRE